MNSFIMHEIIFAIIVHMCIFLGVAFSRDSFVYNTQKLKLDWLNKV